MVHLSTIISPQQPAVAEHLNKPVPNQPNNLGERQLYKNRLQEYTQRLGLPFPVYQTTNEGFQHAPRFRSTVLVDGSSYTSTDTFLQRKAAEQDASRVALDELTPKMKDEGRRLICKDTVFCKSILNEYAVKMNLEMPTYTTIQPGGVLPVFVSNLVFNGATYTGDLAKSKKEAEQLAARVVIQSIMGNSDSGTTMSEIIKCKFKLYAPSSEVTDSNNAHNDFMPVSVMPAAVNSGDSLGFPLSKGKELEGTGCTNSMPTTASPKTLSGKLRNVPATFESFHEFKKPKFVPSSEAITPPIVFVPPVLEQSLGVGSSSAKKRNRKNKKAKRKNPA
ncbi:double-stranded RNA-binding protein 4-like [Rhododendron vialii]|uniref:double-stranded RNA-binding protein 4-like n=1 Tax=Rhododendron vialii TaxID=182163 RepID=UPI00265FD3F3|nr:double-stranded RNA-binding protein 4-like [Rhododendron vialii]